MSDGQITFSTALDNSQLEKDLRDVGKMVDELEKKLQSGEHNKSVVSEQMEQAQREIEKTAQKVVELKNQLEELRTRAAADPSILPEAETVAGELQSHVKILEEQSRKSETLKEKWNKLDIECRQYARELESARANQVGLTSELQRTATSAKASWSGASNTMRAKLAAVAASARSAFANAANGALQPWSNLASRIGRSFRKVFVFTAIVAAIRALKTELGSVLSKNRQFQANVENLKAVMRGFISSFASAILPALNAIASTLAAVFERIAGIIDSIFGTNIVGAIQEQRNAASAAIQQANNEKSVDYQNKQAKASKKQADAAKRLAKEQEKANRQLMSFDEINAMTADSADEAADVVDDYADDISAPDYETDWTQSIAPDFGVLGGILDWLDSLRDRLLNDVEGPFARIREGLQLIARGWDEIVKGFQTGDWSLVWKGIGDIVIGACYVIEGAFGAFVDWLDEITGGRFHEIFEGLKLTVHGAVEFIEGILRGDLPLAMQGFFDFFDGLGQMTLGHLDIILDGISRFFNGFVDECEKRWSMFFDALGKKFPELKGLFEALKTFVIGGFETIRGVFNGVVSFVRETVVGLVNGVVDVIKGAFTVIVGLFTGDSSMITNGFRLIINGIISILNGALHGILSGAIDVLNGIISAANHIPGVSIEYASVPRISIPQLAKGAVIPPNSEFLAVLGDQKRGRNVEAPEDLIRQIVRDETGKELSSSLVTAFMQVMPMIQQQSADDVVMNVYLDGQLIAKSVNENNANLARRGMVKPEFVFV